MRGGVGSWGGKGKGAACVGSRAGGSMTHGSMWEELSPPGETSCAGLPRGSRHLPASKHPPGEVPLTESIHGTRNSSPPLLGGLREVCWSQQLRYLHCPV